GGAAGGAGPPGHRAVRDADRGRRGGEGGRQSQGRDECDLLGSDGGVQGERGRRTQPVPAAVRQGGQAGPVHVDRQTARREQLLALRPEVRRHRSRAATRAVHHGRATAVRGGPGEQGQARCHQDRTDADFDAFGALSTDLQGVPEISFAAADAQGRYARFFEQAFEWEQMMYFLYPYYWAAKQRWSSMVRAGDDDPLFLDFLKAGFARVVIAVRPGFESAVVHFLETGEIWNGGDLPPITGPLYLNIVEEVREATRAAGRPSSAAASAYTARGRRDLSRRQSTVDAQGR